MITAFALALGGTATAQGDPDNRGTIKIHDDETADPETRNEPHVSCDFWVEGFNMKDPEGHLEFYSWPPTGSKEEVTPSGDSLNWTGTPDGDGEYDFLKGPYSLPEGHYRVEAYTDDAHPGHEHFAKAKMFWVDECQPENPPEHPDCPTDLNARAEADTSGDPINIIEWDAVTDADSYRIYRAVEGGDFEFVDSTTETSYTDTDVEVGVSYEYTVNAVVDNVESEDCDIVEVTAVPFFGAPILGALALVGSVGALMYFRRK